MKKQLNRILNIITGITIGVFMGTSFYRYWDYYAHLDLYQTQSAPWYVHILIPALLTIVIVIICFITKIIITHKNKENHTL